MTLYNFSMLSKKQQAKKISVCAERLLHAMPLEPGRESLRKEFEKLVSYCASFRTRWRDTDGWPETPVFAEFDALSLKKKTALVSILRYRTLDAAGIPQPESDFSPAPGGTPAGTARKNLSVLIDNVRSPFNIGSIVRTAEAFGFSEAALAGMAAASNEKKVRRSAMSADDHIGLIRLFTPREALDWLDAKKAGGFRIVSLEKTASSQPLGAEIPRDRAVIVAGNEEFGISDEILAVSDLVLHIPLTGFKNSLNVAVAFGIAAAFASGNHSS